ncbi:MAG: CotH kinase family protein, partial [Clostridia bacterium]|nr:CotH kinase family protein [Clostridia bacterium]
SSSLRYEKKNYTIDLYESTDFSQKLKIDVGWGKESKYCLKANWIDKTHSRNVVTARLASQVQKKYGLFTDTPNNAVIDGFPVEIYVNGSFHGLYTMNIPKDSWMFNMDDSNPDHIVVCGEDWLDSVLFNEIPTDFSGWSVEVGSQSPETLKKLQRLIRFVKESSDKRFKRDFGKYLDLDSTLNYYVMMNYCWMPDNVGKNMLMATYDGKVWYPSLYDLDTTWGTSYDGTYLYNYKNRSVSLNNSLLWIRLEKNFSKEIAERYFELRETVLDPQHVINTFNEFYNGIPQEVLDREKTKWSTQDTHIPGYPLTQIQKYLDTVVPYLDNKYSEWK